MCCRRTPLPAPVAGGDRGVSLGGLSLPDHRAAVCCDGAGVGPHPEGEAEEETVHPGGLRKRMEMTAEL